MYEHVQRRRARRKGLLSCHTLPADLMEYGDSPSLAGAHIPRYAMRPQHFLASDHARLPLLGPAVGPCRDISLSRTLCLVATWHSETTGHRSWSFGAPQLPHWDFFRSRPQLWRPARVPEVALLAGSLFVTTQEDQLPTPQPPPLAFSKLPTSLPWDYWTNERGSTHFPRPPGAARLACPYYHTTILLDTPARSRIQANGF